MTGLIDIAGRKFYSWSIKALVHLCNQWINLKKDDLLLLNSDLDDNDD